MTTIYSSDIDLRRSEPSEVFSQRTNLFFFFFKVSEDLKKSTVNFERLGRWARMGLNPVPPVYQRRVHNLSAIDGANI